MRLFESLGKTGKPDLYASHGLRHLALFTANLDLAGWGSLTELPTQQWVENACVLLDPFVQFNTVCLNHESWPVSTQPERIATAQKFVTLIGMMKAERPDWQIGIYDYFPIRSYGRAILGSQDAQYIAWQAENDDMQPIGAVVDMVFPNLYTTGNVTDANNLLFLNANIAETNRVIAASGRTLPAYAFLSFRNVNDTGLIPIQQWRDDMRVSVAELDGLVLWSKSATVWDGFADWWSAFKTMYPFGSTALQIPRTPRN